MGRSQTIIASIQKEIDLDNKKIANYEEQEKTLLKTIYSYKH